MWLLFMLGTLCVVILLIGYALFGYRNGFEGFNRLPVTPRMPIPDPQNSLETVYFPAVDGTQLEGWLLRPNAEGNHPLVIMAPGLTSTKECHLEHFAWQFVQEGLAVLLFDFRCFGGSEGEPRHWVDPFRQVDDFQSAVRFARDELARDGVINSRRIALWGSSFSGGSALVAATDLGSISAVVAQCPFVEVPKEQEPSLLAMVRYVLWTTLDIARMGVDRLFPGKCQPVYIPAFGRPGEFAFATSRENPSRFDTEQKGSVFFQTLPEPLRGGWENKLLARFLAEFDKFKPIDKIASLQCPIYLIAAEHDDLVPLRYLQKAHAQIESGKAEMTIYDCGHFDLYLDPIRVENAKRQALFLSRHLHG